MRCLVVDDEPLARKLLEEYIEKVDGLDWVGSCSNAIQAFSNLQQNEVDLLFLDIQMPQVTGIELLKSLRSAPHVILTTAYREYAYEAYDLDVVDYLLKPITFERFLRAIGKIYQISGIETENSQNFEKDNKPYIYFKEKREMRKVFLDAILYIESMRDYVKIQTVADQIITYQKISYLEQRLPESEFLRIHRSFIVPFEKVSSFNSNAVCIDGKEIPIGRKYKSETIKALMKNNVIES